MPRQEFKQFRQSGEKLANKGPDYGRAVMSNRVLIELCHSQKTVKFLDGVDYDTFKRHIGRGEHTVLPECVARQGLFRSPGATS